MVRVRPMASVIFEFFALGTFCIDFILIGSFGFLTITVSVNVLLDTSVTWLCSIVRLSCKQEIGGSSPPRAYFLANDFAIFTPCVCSSFLFIVFELEYYQLFHFCILSLIRLSSIVVIVLALKTGNRWFESAQWPLLSLNFLLSVHSA